MRDQNTLRNWMPPETYMTAAGFLFFAAMAAAWHMRGYDHAVSFGLGAVYSISVVAVGFKWIDWRMS